MQHGSFGETRHMGRIWACGMAYNREAYVWGQRSSIRFYSEAFSIEMPFYKIAIT